MLSTRPYQLHPPSPLGWEAFWVIAQISLTGGGDNTTMTHCNKLFSVNSSTDKGRQFSINILYFLLKIFQKIQKSVFLKWQGTFSVKYFQYYKVNSSLGGSPIVNTMCRIRRREKKSLESPIKSLVWMISFLPINFFILKLLCSITATSVLHIPFCPRTFQSNITIHIPCFLLQMFHTPKNSLLNWPLSDPLLIGAASMKIFAKIRIDSLIF